MTSKLDKELKELEKENEKLENLLEKGFDKYIADEKKLKEQLSKIKEQAKKSRKKYESLDTDFTIAKQIKEFKTLTVEMNHDKLNEKIEKLQAQKNNLKKQIKDTNISIKNLQKG